MSTNQTESNTKATTKKWPAPRIKLESDKHNPKENPDQIDCQIEKKSTVENKWW